MIATKRIGNDVHHFYFIYVQSIFFCSYIYLMCFSFQMFDPSMLDSAIEEICSDGISDDISDEGIDLLGGMDENENKLRSISIFYFTLDLFK